MPTPERSEGHQQSFADVLSSLGNGHGPARSREAFNYQLRPDKPAVEQLAIPWPAPSRHAAGPRAGEAQWPAASGEWGEPEGFASAVRPYTWTRGRTWPVYYLEVETLVSTCAQGPDLAALSSVEHRAVAELCREPRSVAEVAALLCLPLGVARVLLADMADIGFVVVHRTATNSGDASEFGMMERVLSGLRRL